MVEYRLKISGLDCVDCARGLEASIANMEGVESAQLSFFDAALTVRGDVGEKALRRMIAKLGYGVEDEDQAGKSPADEPNALVGFWRYLLQSLETRLALIAGGIIFLSLAAGWLGLPEWVAISLQIGALVLAGWPIARSGVVNLWVNHTFNINFLMTLAGIGAVVIGEYAEAASMILLFDLAEALEGFTNEKARGTLSQLTKLKPSHAILFGDADERLVPVDSLSLGDKILVRAGDRIPVDGTILEGESDINQAPVTGESIPVWKAAGMEVFQRNGQRHRANHSGSDPPGSRQHPEPDHRHGHRSAIPPIQKSEVH